MKSGILLIVLALFLTSCSDSQTAGTPAQDEGGSQDNGSVGDNGDGGANGDDGSGNIGDDGNNGGGDTGGNGSNGDGGNVANCPTGFVKIAQGFAKTICIAQFEMKKVDDKVISEALGKPHSSSRLEAESLCATSYTSGRLPTNAEWTKIAHIIKSQDQNWTGGAVGIGALVSGLTKRWGDPVSVNNVNDGYDQTGSSSTNQSEQRRVFYVDAQNVIWDFGGNAWEWVSDEIYGSSYSPSFVDNWAHNPKDTYWFPNGSAQLEHFFLGERPGSTNYLGYVFGGNNGHVVRGAGTYMNSNEVGIFTADLGSAINLKAPSNYGLPSSARNVGFRCVVELE